MNKIFVTGDAGFIGSALVTALNEKHVRTEGYDIKNNPRDDVNNFQRLATRIRHFRPDGIVHLAAVSRVEDGFLNPLLCFETNAMATAHILEVMRTLKREGAKAPWLIYASSREVFGEPKPEDLPITEHSPKKPINVYAVAKLASEMLVKNYADNYSLKAWVLRFSNVYTGERDRTERVIPRFIQQALANLPLTINGGEQIFAFTHLDDTVDGIAKCIETIEQSSVPFDDFNLVSNERFSIRELAHMIVRLAESGSEIVFGPPRQYDVNCFWGDPEKPVRVLGWHPSITLEVGLKKSIEEFRRAL